jgi:hypothetical protein
VAYESGVPGLVLHRPLRDPQIGEEFLVAHESGSMIFPYAFPSLQEAQRAAERLADLADWTQPGPALQGTLKDADVEDAITANHSMELAITPSGGLDART